MKTLKLILITLATSLLFFIGCGEKEITNPFDEGCPKELFTPADFKAAMEGNSVKLSWAQENMQINGYVVNRSENDGTMAEVARIDKSTKSWTDTKVAGGAKYNYQLYAYAGANLSNPQQTTITTPALGATVTTMSASNITSIGAELGGNVTADGGAAVTERGICFNTTQNPTVANSKVLIGSGTGSFNETVENLTPNTKYYVKAFATNSYGTTYGAEISFTTLPVSVAVVTTEEAAGITSNSAILGGNVISDGGETVTERGICYSTTQNPNVANNKTPIGNGTGTFTNIITGLEANATYYVRAYIINNQGITYGAEITFTTLAESTATVTTMNATDITSISATLGGNVTSDGGASVTERGICYSTSENPTTSNSKVSIGNGIGSFNQSITGLTANTTYYARAYAINNEGTAYGSQISFTTQDVSLATVTTADASAITSNSAVLGGNVTEDGGATVTERGTCYSTSQNPTIADNKVPNGNGIGSFNSTVSGLIANTDYYVRSYAINTKGTAYGSQISFTTTAPIEVPIVATGDIVSITPVTAAVTGYVSSAGSSTVTERGFCFSTNQNPTIAGKLVTSGNGTGSFNASLTILIPNTTYYIRAYAINTAGIGYGEEKIFTTTDSYYEGFETGYPPSWTGIGWGVTTEEQYDGFNCLGTSQLSDSISFTRTITTSPNGNISFYYKSTTGNSSVYYMSTSFYIDGVLQATFWDKSWIKHSYSVPAGTHTFKWKVTGVYAGIGAFIDYIVVSP